MEVGDWLRRVGLPQYEERFRENAIDSRVLLDLNEIDLEKLGAPLGHRKRMLKAIDALRAAERESTALNLAAERRQLTIMFCDLVGSTAMAAELDPEDMSEVLRAFQSTVVSAVARLDGHVAKFMGDGALVYFGYPRAHEDDAERAVRAGLGIVEALHRIHPLPDIAMQARIGIASGLVVVGELLCAGETREHGVVGETPNLAARLQSQATPGGVTICGATRLLIGGTFELNLLDPLVLKGFSAPIEAWSVLRETENVSRFEALRASHHTAFVGRDQEVGDLMRLWRLAREGHGQVVLISGEPGIGKSRLAIALQECLPPEEHIRVRYFCSPHRSASPLYPVIETIARAADFGRADTPQQRLSKLTDALEPVIRGSTVNLSLIAELMSLPIDPVVRDSPLSPLKRKELTLNTLIESIRVMSKQKPLLLCFEDAHWSDPTSLELLSMFVSIAPSMKVLVIVTARPEFRSAWRDHPCVTVLPIGRLSFEAAAEMVDYMAGDIPIPTTVKADILARADGVPLFLEELTKTVIEGDSAGAETVSSAFAATPIPATLHASLLARIDRLPNVKDIAQTAAVIGRDFSFELLHAITQIDSTFLQHALNELVHSDLISLHGSHSGVVYRFKHALVRDAAYGTLLRRRRKLIHTQIVSTLEQRFPETARSQPELLAQHCVDAGLSEKAITYWMRAGQHAQSRAAMVEATTAFKQGLELLHGLPQSEDRDRTELQMQLALSRATIGIDGYAAPSSKMVFDRARVLCDRLNQPPELVSVLYGQWAHALMRTDLQQAQRTADELLQLGELRQDAVWTARGCRLKGLTCIARGQFEAGRRYLERGLQLYDPKERNRHASFMLYDPQIMLRIFLAGSLFDLGYIDQARDLWRGALTDARNSRQPFTFPYALTLSVLGQLSVDDFESALHGSEELVSYCNENAVAFFWGIGMIFHGRSLVASGRANQGFREIDLGLSAYRQTHGTLWLPSQLTMIADALGTVGRPQEGLCRLDEAYEYIAIAGEHYAESPIHRVRGELLGKLGDASNARVSLMKALDIAHRQGGRVLELRATISLARFHNAIGERDEARRIIIPITERFTEGLDTPAYREAYALADALGGRRTEAIDHEQQTGWPTAGNAVSRF